ncbi:MAG TPA: DUF1127 domain-containing protein [Beijerinckiaceae bacterium]|nr:DUF1127 domain-containing protein [Beijerinckiaceae bacterium]
MDTTHFRAHVQQSRAIDWLGGIAAWLGACLERSRQRRDLGRLSDELLKDIGLCRADVAHECGRWAWDGLPIPKLGGLSPRPDQATVRSMTWWPSSVRCPSGRPRSSGNGRR